MYYAKAISAGAPELQSLGAVSAIIDDYGFTSSWRANDNAASGSGDIWNASDPENSSTWLWGALPNVFIIRTSDMQIVKAEDLDGQLDVPAEVAAINAE